MVQVVTDSASAYILAGEKLMEKRRKIFWNPCAAHCIDMMLHDIDDLSVHANTIKKAKNIIVFIYRHIRMLDLMRKYTKGREFVRQCVTIILSDPKFWPTIKFCLKCVIPLVKVLRLVDDGAKPAMCYIYEPID